MTAAQSLRAIHDVIPGDFVEVTLIGPDIKETAWVRVSAVGPLGFAGSLAKQPVCPDMQKSDRICRPWSDVLDHLNALEFEE